MMHQGPNYSPDNGGGNGPGDGPGRGPHDVLSKVVNSILNEKDSGKFERATAAILNAASVFDNDPAQAYALTSTVKSLVDSLDELRSTVASAHDRAFVEQALKDGKAIKQRDDSLKRLDQQVDATRSSSHTKDSFNEVQAGKRFNDVKTRFNAEFQGAWEALEERHIDAVGMAMLQAQRALQGSKLFLDTEQAFSLNGVHFAAGMHKGDSILDALEKVVERVRKSASGALSLDQVEQAAKDLSDIAKFQRVLKALPPEHIANVNSGDRLNREPSDRLARLNSGLKGLSTELVRTLQNGGEVELCAAQPGRASACALSVDGLGRLVARVYQATDRGESSISFELADLNDASGRASAESKIAKLKEVLKNPAELFTSAGTVNGGSAIFSNLFDLSSRRLTAADNCMFDKSARLVGLVVQDAVLAGVYFEEVSIEFARFKGVDFVESGFRHCGGIHNDFEDLRFFSKAEASLIDDLRGPLRADVQSDDKAFGFVGNYFVNGSMENVTLGRARFAKNRLYEVETKNVESEYANERLEKDRPTQAKLAGAALALPRWLDAKLYNGAWIPTRFNSRVGGNLITEGFIPVRDSLLLSGLAQTVGFGSSAASIRQASDSSVQKSIELLKEVLPPRSPSLGLTHIKGDYNISGYEDRLIVQLPEALVPRAPELALALVHARSRDDAQSKTRPQVGGVFASIVVMERTGRGWAVSEDYTVDDQYRIESDRVRRCEHVLKEFADGKVHFKKKKRDKGG